MAALSQKFVEEQGAFQLTYGRSDKFYGGIEAVVGPPNVKVAETMEVEHCRSDDSALEFLSPNYKITTTSALEWQFVTDPQQMAEIPKEVMEAHAATFIPRVPRPLADFDATLGTTMTAASSRRPAPPHPPALTATKHTLPGEELITNSEQIVEYYVRNGLGAPIKVFYCVDAPVTETSYTPDAAARKRAAAETALRSHNGAI